MIEGTWLIGNSKQEGEELFWESDCSREEATSPSC